MEIEITIWALETGFLIGRQCIQKPGYPDSVIWPDMQRIRPIGTYPISLSGLTLYDE